jgi:integrase
MTAKKAQSIRRLVERAEDAEEMGRADGDAILEAHREIELLGRQEFSVASHEAILMRVCTLAKRVGGVAEAVEDRDAAEGLVRHINEMYDNPETNKRARTALRTFGRLVVDDADTETGVPESLDWIPTGYPSTYDPSPEPGKMYRWQAHIEPMLAASQNPRDEALVALCWDLGPRTSELYELKVRDITDATFGLRVSIRNGKNGSRSPTLVPSVPYVQNWLQRHPGEPDDHLWSKLSTPERVSQQMLRKALRKLADRADMEPPSKPTPTRLRKSSASYLASEGVSQAHLEEHHGWVRGSDQAARYIAVFGEASDRAIAAAHGLDTPAADSGDATSTVECFRCGTMTPNTDGVCDSCGQALDPETAADIEAVLEALRDGLISAEDIETREALVSAERTVTNDPSSATEMAERLDGFID